MQLISILALAFLAISHVSSYPAAEPNPGMTVRSDSDDFAPNDVFKRASAKAVQCGTGEDKEDYTAKKIKGQVANAKDRLKKNNLVDGYPKFYGKNDVKVLKALPEECKNVRLYEWPIQRDGTYKGGEPGLDRILINEVKQKDNIFVRTYCMTITHRGTTDNFFVPCPESK